MAAINSIFLFYISSTRFTICRDPVCLRSTWLLCLVWQCLRFIVFCLRNEQKKCMMWFAGLVGHAIDCLTGLANWLFTFQACTSILLPPLSAGAQGLGCIDEGLKAVAHWCPVSPQRSLHLDILSCLFIENGKIYIYLFFRSQAFLMAIQNLYDELHV